MQVVWAKERRRPWATTISSSGPHICFFSSGRHEPPQFPLQRHHICFFREKLLLVHFGPLKFDFKNPSASLKKANCTFSHAIESNQISRVVISESFRSSLKSNPMHVTLDDEVGVAPPSPPIEMNIVEKLKKKEISFPEVNLKSFGT